jgi:hypothetical protein
LRENFEDEKRYTLALQLFGNTLIWISLYYFTFELIIIKSTLEAQSREELNKTKS